MRAQKVSVAHARRFHRRAAGLDAPVEALPVALARMGYVQLDPIQVCGRMHDLILRNRVQGYSEGALLQHTHGSSAPLPREERSAFEHFLPRGGVLAVFGLEAWPYLRRAMERRKGRDDAWSGKLQGEERALARTLLAELEKRGPCASTDFEDRRKAQRVWGEATLVKHTLQKLFFHGAVLVARRGSGQRRYYDLPERVLPAAALASAVPSEKEQARWEVLLRLRQRRLAVLDAEERALVEEQTLALQVEGGLELRCLREDAALLEATAKESVEAGETLLLAPLDPLVYDRKLTRELWGFDYKWEAYTPPAQRKRGYYALPVLAGSALVGHVDPKADREARKLVVQARAVQRGHSTKDAVSSLARFLGLRT